ncbi:ABC transporter ATP-binding protein [Wenyingzhuangia marina]|uniref:Iron complex transport system ATP-binding protein n=1 Tax=Wenyingzhuangia marina TaxID=1195760 RepID=A0A1M5W857_9FLAO|nr:ABC transporter ATP-binding protein [Wenyingzhuangia marina]GGF75199.1 ABC transporter ATP-binding protein [Wenyingzhuangia marina]SHH83667.1 iron complex transport system ATP-binding protein [Wenyingzhuangia marina]
MKNVILKTNNLNIGYTISKKSVSICKQINFELYKGELLCLLGRNGSGKSTLLKTMAKMLTPIQGSIEINEENIENLSPKELAKFIAVVLTESIPENSLTVYETIALGRQPYTNWLGKLFDKDINIIQNAMLLTDTNNLANKLIHQLSDGQLQRVMIARALTQDTPIILLDEPTSHLDIHHKINIFKILAKICKETQKTVLISTHEINLALKTSDRLLLIDQEKFKIGKSTDNIIQENLMTIFNSDDIRYDSTSNQFIF